MRALTYVLVSTLVVAAVAHAAAIDTLSATPDEPRAYGYFVGDIVTRRIQLEGITKDLDISSKAGKSARSFELKGNKKLTCDEAFD